MFCATDLFCGIGEHVQLRVGVGPEVLSAEDVIGSGTIYQRLLLKGRLCENAISPSVKGGAIISLYG